MMGSMMRRAMLGDGSTLSLDFTQMSTLADLTSRGLTFSRSTSGTFINASGLVATATAGNPRFDYDTSGNPRGILIEGSASNLVYHSETFRLTAVASEPYWADSASISRGSDTAPDGTAGAAVNFVATGTAGTVIQTAAVGSSANRTFSFWARRSGGGTVEYTLDNGTTWTAVTITASWARYTATATNANQRVGFRIATGNGTLIWGAQLEAGSGASSYIPSGASQGSRGQDGMTMADISSLNFNQSGGTVMMQIDGGPRDLNTFPYFAQFEKSPSGRGWGFLRMNVSSSVGPRIFGTAFDNAGSIIITSSNHLRPSGKVKFATTLEPSVARMTWVIAGGSALVNTAAAGTLATIGSLKFNNTTETAATDFGSVWVSQFKYWPSVLPESQMQAITT